MSEQEHKQDTGHLDELNAELSDSLDRCRAMVRDCRSKLIASGDNDEEPDAAMRRA